MSVFDILCPCHAQLSQTGHILHLGPTLAKLLGDAPALPVRYLELFELRRPHPAASMKVRFALAGQKLTFRLRAAPHTDLKAVLALLPDGQGAVVNFSFGIAIQNVVQRHSLTHSDFAGTDLAIEMLYILEAKNAAMEASQLEPTFARRKNCRRRTGLYRYADGAEKPPRAEFGSGAAK